MTHTRFASSYALALLLGLISLPAWGQAPPKASKVSALQNASEARWQVAVGATWLNPDGEIRLVRGDRKVVTNDAFSNAGIDGRVAYRVRRRIGISLSVSHATFSFLDRESFTIGEVIEERDDLHYTVFLGGVDVHLLPRRRWDPYVTGQVGYVLFNNELHLRSERVLPDDLSTINPEDIIFAVKDFIGIGVKAGLNWPLADRWFLNLEAGMTLTRLLADLIDQHRRRNNVVDLPLNPWGGSLRLGYRF